MAKRTRKNGKRNKARSSSAEFEARVRQEVGRRITIAVVTTVGNVLSNLFKYAPIPVSVAAICWACVRAAPHVAGKNTKVEVLIAAVFEGLAQDWLAWSVSGVLGLSHVIWVRSLRGRLAKISDEKKALELMRDDRRSSSGLTAMGKHEDD